MRFVPPRREKPRSLRSIAISVAVHGALAMVLAAVTFHIPIEAFFQDRPPQPQVTKLTFMRVASGPKNPRGSGPPPALPKVAVPVLVAPPPQITAPVTIPNVIPPPPSGTASSQLGGIPGGTGTGVAGGDPVNPKRGIEPAVPDPRISLQPIPYGAPKSLGAKTDSVIHAAYAEYRDSLLSYQANKGRAPGDWTFDRNGQKWGWDQKGIQLGKFTIPNLILAALPLKVGPTGKSINALTDARTASWTQADLWAHSQSMSESDFRAAVQRIRERVDRERAEKEKAAALPPGKKPPG